MCLQDVLLLVRSIAGHPCNKCYYHLALVVYHCCDAPLYQGFSLEHVYPIIADELQITTVSISRSIARANTDCWTYGKHQKLEQIAGCKLDQKPSPKELVYYLSDYLVRTKTL